MSEWLPFVGFTKYVGYNNTKFWYPMSAEYEVYNMSSYTEDKKEYIFQRATNVSASVSKVDDFSYRFTVRFRHLIPRFVTSDFRYEDYALFLVKGRLDPNFYPPTMYKPRNNHILFGNCYLFGHPGMYNNITAKQVEGTLPDLYDVEYSGVQVVRECVNDYGGFFISQICQ